MNNRILIIGYNEYQGRHFESLQNLNKFEILFSNTYSLIEIENINFSPDIVIVTDEHYCELANIVNYFKSKNVLTLQLMDGILEWRRTWEFEFNGNKIDEIHTPLNQPIVADKIACLGFKDFRIFESWGNVNKCEIVGIPRIDYLMDYINEYDDKSNYEKKRILIATAKTPGFTLEQVEITKRSLLDLKKFFENNNEIEIVWRITNNLYEQLGIKNILNDLNGKELHEIIKNVDAIITTPSTTILEGMILNVPVATLDYHNKPHYFETVWSIYSNNNIETVVNEILNPKKNQMDYQNFLLNDQLQIRTSATNRLVELIDKMILNKKRNNFLPNSILDNSFYTKNILSSNYGEYFDKLKEYDKMDIKKLKMELISSKGVIDVLDKKLYKLNNKLKFCIFYQILKKIKKLLNKL
jgi:hypothetical protein